MSKSGHGDRGRLRKFADKGVGRGSRNPKILLSYFLKAPHRGSGLGHSAVTLHSNALAYITTTTMLVVSLYLHEHNIIPA